MNRFLMSKALNESFAFKTPKKTGFSLTEAFEELDSLYEADAQADAQADDAVETENAAAASSAKPVGLDAKAEQQAEATLDKLKDSDYVEFVNILNSDGKSKAFIEYLRAHYKLGDDTIETIKKAGMTKDTIKCSDLHPTQKDISLDKSLGVIKKGGWSEKIIKEPASAFTTPTVTYGGKFIIDGHHRWSKAYALNGPDCVITTLNFPAIPGVNWEDLLKAVQLAIVSTHPSADLINEIKPDNMLTMQPDAIKKYVVDNMCDEVLKAMSLKGRGKTKEEVADTVANNVAAMQQNSKPAQGAKPRSHMPQIPDNSHAYKKLQKAVIDLT